MFGTEVDSMDVGEEPTFQTLVNIIIICQKQDKIWPFYITTFSMRFTNFILTSSWGFRWVASIQH